MTKPNSATIRSGAIVTLLIAAAVACRLLGIIGILSAPLNMIRSAIYLGVFSAWGISVRNRIIHPQARQYLTAIVLLLVFWFLVRTVKFLFVSPSQAPGLTRHLWYLYYLPILFIPLLSVFVAMVLGKPESFHLPKWTALLYIPATALFLLVMTNDFHQLVFTFPPEATVWLNADSSHAAGYFVAVGWAGACTVTALITMLVKCRAPRSRTVLVLPCVPVVVMLLYGILYVSGAQWLRTVAGDMTAVFGLLLIATLEGCIQCGLIPSNTHYADLFMSCTLRVQLTDPNYQVLLASHSAESIPPETMRRTEAEPVQLDGGLRLSGARIQGGHVLWAEDVSELLDILDALQDTQDSLEDNNALLSAEYALKAREAHIAEQDRLYNIIQRETATRITLLADLTDQFEKAENEAERKKLLEKMVVIGAYLKRRSNLIFLADKTPVLQETELNLTFGESLDNLELYGVTCGLVNELTGPVRAVRLAAMYDFFEEVVERSLDSMTTLTVRISKRETTLRILINTDAGADFSGIASAPVTALRDEDGEWQLSMEIDMGGDVE